MVRLLEAKDGVQWLAGVGVGIHFLAVTYLFPSKVRIDLVAGNINRPVSALFNEHTTVHPMLPQLSEPLCQRLASACGT